MAEADIVCMILENGPVVERVLFELRTVQRIRPGSLVIDLSSIPPETAKEHALRLARQGVDHLDAPVSGGPYGAEAGSLAIMVGAAAIAAVSEALLLAKPAGFSSWRPCPYPSRRLGLGYLNGTGSESGATHVTVGSGHFR